MLKKLSPFFKFPQPVDEPDGRDNTGQHHVSFHKYHGAGNDFILLDNSDGKYNALCQDEAQLRRMCERRFSIGADGVVVLSKHTDYAFQMTYFNADGREGSLCGNGSRCAVAFAKQLGMLHYNEAHFLAFDGLHYAIFDDINHLIHLKMSNVTDITVHNEDEYFVDSGSPHHILFTDGHIHEMDIMKHAMDIRKSDLYPAAVNFNLVWPNPEGYLEIRTHERGVEAETFACGTGAVAAVLAHSLRNHRTQSSQGGSPDLPKVIPGLCHFPKCHIDPDAMEHTHVKAKGGQLIVTYEKAGERHFKEIYLIGPAEYVFSGTYSIPND